MLISNRKKVHIRITGALSTHLLSMSQNLWNLYRWRFQAKISGLESPKARYRYRRGVYAGMYDIYVSM